MRNPFSCHDAATEGISSVSSGVSGRGCSGGGTERRSALLLSDLQTKLCEAQLLPGFRQRTLSLVHLHSAPSEQHLGPCLNPYARAEARCLSRAYAISLVAV